MRVASIYVVLLSVCLFGGCSSKDASSPGHSATGSPGAHSVTPDGAGSTPEGTLRAYYFFKDRGRMSKLREIVAASCVDMFRAEDQEGMSERAQNLRGIVVDHSEGTDREATIYCRTWFSLGTRQQGGRPAVFRCVLEDGVWKMDVKASLQLTAAIKKGRNTLGFYDGTKEWWK